MAIEVSPQAEQIEQEILGLKRQVYGISDEISAFQVEGRSIGEELGEYDKQESIFGKIDVDGERKRAKKQERLKELPGLIESKQREMESLNEMIQTKERDLETVRIEGTLQAVRASLDPLIRQVMSRQHEFNNLCHKLIDVMICYQNEFQVLTTAMGSAKKRLQENSIAVGLLPVQPSRDDRMSFSNSLTHHLVTLFREKGLHLC